MHMLICVWLHNHPGRVVRDPISFGISFHVLLCRKVVKQRTSFLVVKLVLANKIVFKSVMFWAAYV